MHWFEQLASFYCSKDTPLYHMSVNTDIEIKLDINGNLLGISSEKLRTIIPATESSITRTSLVIPHALSDRLKYLAAGISEPHHTAYLEQLMKWADSEHSTKRLCAVRTYIQKGSLQNDVQQLNASEDAFVRFTVDGIHLWEDDELIASHIRHMREADAATGLCCVTGTHTVPARSHAKHILPSAGTAKLISSGNKDIAQGTVQGGFSIGQETSLKAHIVLRRMISEGGVTIGNRTYVCWDDTGNAIKLPLLSDLEYTPVGRITIIGFCAATKGRISITFFRRIDPQAFVERFLKWNDTDLSFRTVADTAFGREFSDSYLCTESVYSQTAERLLGCILDNEPIPYDIIAAASKRSSFVAASLNRYKGAAHEIHPEKTRI